MTTAAAANEINHNIGHDFTLSDAYDAEFMDTESAEDEAAGRQELSARMAEWFGLA